MREKSQFFFRLRKTFFFVSVQKKITKNKAPNSNQSTLFQFFPHHLLLLLFFIPSESLRKKKKLLDPVKAVKIEGSSNCGI